MVDINTAFPSKYLRAEDLQGRDASVIISHVTFEDVGSNEIKPIVYFMHKEKGLVLNKTNANTIASVTGQTETDMWVNASIILFPTQTDFQGRQVLCIRVKLLNPAPATQTSAPAIQAAAAIPPPNVPPNAGTPPVVETAGTTGGGDIEDEIPFSAEWR